MTEGRMKRTALYDAHAKAGAKLVPFGGFDMPVQYLEHPERARCGA